MVAKASILLFQEIIFESREAPSPIEPRPLVRSSILKAPKCDDSLVALPKPDEEGPVLKKSFLKLQDSVTSVTKALSGVSAQKPNKNCPELKESFLKLRDSVTEVTNALFSAEKPWVQEGDSLEDMQRASVYYPLEAKTSLFDMLVPCLYHCKAVQKDWKQDEDIMNKEIQVQEPTDSYSQFTLSPLYENLAEDAVSLRLSCVNGHFDGTRQSLLKAKCRREDCNTFACSDICLYQCDGEETCSAK